MNKTMMLLTTMVSIAGTAMCCGDNGLTQGLLNQDGESANENTNKGQSLYKRVGEISQAELTQNSYKTHDETVHAFCVASVELVSNAYYKGHKAPYGIYSGLLSAFEECVIGVDKKIVENVVWDMIDGGCVVFGIVGYNFRANVKTGVINARPSGNTQIAEKDIMRCKRCLLNMLETHGDEWRQQGSFKIGMFDIKGLNIEIAIQQLKREIGEEKCCRCCNIA